MPFDDQVVKSRDFGSKCFFALGALAGVGLLGYGSLYLLVMPAVGPDAFVPIQLEDTRTSRFPFEVVQASFILLYAFSLLPVTIMFTVRENSRSPHALVFACCLLSLSSVLEIVNNLPVLSAGIYPRELQSVPPEVALRLAQGEALRYLAQDAAGFTLIYVAALVYAVVYWESDRWLSLAVATSIVLFLANIPFLWLAPPLAVILMVISVFALIPLPIFMVSKAVG
jgi:hypothetical protein